ncbi:sensor histidine kinase KdpD [Leptolyngbya sp. FACHB-261]|uniref:sensor histidine kinase n=1 Tax=Leptolyngbya sp. FACHB-261 TaxID=2692806 RepID=UPI00168A13BD|nr:HAMP domain-containing sensor histidine kinase [Leptolyngbya sp. FACHB-261]MBD2102879.1 HAMP domain-containing histidine kinase [Leptolyngbya sp. FACHB-261]
MALNAGKQARLGKRLLNPLVRNTKALLARLQVPPGSADYEAWRHRFLMERLQLGLWVAFACLITFVLRDLYNVAFPLKEMQGMPQELAGLWIVMDTLTVLLLLAGLVLRRTQWGYRHPTVLFLGLSWSLTLVPQVLTTLRGLPLPDLLSWSLVFLTQATLIPIRWQLHLISQLGVLVYYVGVYSALGLTVIQGQSIYNVTIFLYLFWFCFICDLAVYLYERLQQAEFESRRELRVFLHAVSHDLRTPVMGTSMVLQKLLQQPTEDVSVTKTTLQRMLQGNERQLTLINSLLEAHLSELQGVVLHCEPVQLCALVQSVLADLDPLLIKSQVVLVNQIADDLPLIQADPIQLWRVFGNLIANALKHNPPGLKLLLTATPEQNFIRCTIEDNGIGINPSQLRRLFELYVRGTRSRYTPGLGLGLYLCRQIITAHGGDIGVSSELEAGSTFWFTLPCAGQTALPRALP